MIKKILADFLGRDRNSKADLFLSGMFLVYMVAYFLVPYKPWTSPVSLHTPLLVLGLALVGLRMLAQKPSFKIMFSDELPFLLLMLVFFLISSLFVHFDKFSISGFQAYIFSFLCFVFIRFTVRHLNLDLLHAWMNFYLISSAVLILLQVNFAGLFYVSGFLGQSGLGRGLQGWGFSNSSTLAGGVMAWFLTVELARYSLSTVGKVFRFRDIAELCAIGLGAVGLFYTLSRAAWVGCILAAGCVLIALYVSKSPKKNFVKALISGMVFITIFGVFLRPEVYKKKEKIMFFVQVMSAPKNTVAHDASANTRARAWGVALRGIRSAPVWGIGLNQFPIIYQQAYLALAKSSNGIIDLNQNINPHNSYLYYAVEVGLLPALFLFLLIARIIIMGLKEGFASRAFPFLMGLIAVCCWVFTNDFLKERVFWIVLSITAGLAVPGREGKSSPAAPPHA